MSKRCIYKGVEEPSFLLAWTMMELSLCLGIFGVIGIFCNQYMLGMVISGAALYLVVVKRAEGAARCQMQHILYKFGLCLGGKSLQQTLDGNPKLLSSKKAQTIFPASSSVEFLP